MLQLFNFAPVKVIAMQLRNKLAALASGAASVVAVAPAHAALPAEVTTMFTTVSGDATAAMGLGWTLFALVTGGFILFKIVKKAVGKAT